MPQPVLVIIDVQERLFNAMEAEQRGEMIRNLKILGAAARRLGGCAGEGGLQPGAP